MKREDTWYSTTYLMVLSAQHLGSTALYYMNEARNSGLHAEEIFMQHFQNLSFPSDVTYKLYMMDAVC